MGSNYMGVAPLMQKQNTPISAFEETIALTHREREIYGASHQIIRNLTRPPEENLSAPYVIFATCRTRLLMVRIYPSLRGAKPIRSYALLVRCFKVLLPFLPDITLGACIIGSLGGANML